MALWESVVRSGSCADSAFLGCGTSLAAGDLATRSSLRGALESLRGRSVLIATYDQLPTAVALLELDGVARRVVLCTPELSAQTRSGVAATAQAEAIILDAAALSAGMASVPGLLPVVMQVPPADAAPSRHATGNTEWILLTSGTTGAPKLVVHTLASLAGSLTATPVTTAPSAPTVWSTFYDIRRYGGLQIYLRAVLGGSRLVLSSAGESTRDFCARAGAAGVTHISGTPSHWRRALMSGAAGLLSPRYVRLSGEVADQALLDSLKSAFPQAQVSHAFASTEAGVAFDVNDGRAGFPAQLVAANGGGIDMKVEEGTLRIRSGRNAVRYLGSEDACVVSGDGYVDTGDLVELVEGRYYFRGRRGGVINVGGLKVFPEEVEAVLNAEPRVRMSLVRGRRSPITGAVVVADVVLSDPDPATAVPGSLETVKTDLMAACRRVLPAHKVPTLLRFVPALEVTAAGKLVRPDA